MKVSYNWLDKEYFGGKLPSLKNLTMTSFEVESVEEMSDGDLLIDVKVTPNRAHDCLSYNGLAREFALANDIAVEWKRSWGGKSSLDVSGDARSLEIDIVESALCKRYIGRVIENVKVGDSPAWLKERLNSIGQRSINNVVDAANYVMWITGQPMHAFDADKISGGKIFVRKARVGETITTLDNKEVALSEDVFVIADSESPVAIAGIKGGKKAEVAAGTVSLILESANFHPTNIRRTSRAVGIKTDASYRFEHEISAEVAMGAMELLSDLILSLAQTPKTLVGPLVDKYERKPKQYKVGASLREVNSVLGLSFAESELVEILNKLKKYLGFGWEEVEPLEKILGLAQRYVGVPYKYGSSVTYDAPLAFDCSGFIAFLYSEVGVAVPRISIDQYFFGDEVAEPDLQLGDLIFAVGDGSDNAKVYKESVEFLPGIRFEKGINHVGLYVGDGKVAHANGRSGNVLVEEYRASASFKNICGFRRILRDSDSRFVVTVPHERLDLVSQGRFYSGGNKEDLIEEIARVYGYARIESMLPETVRLKPAVNKNYYYMEMARTIFSDLGFSEVYNYVFVGGGDANKYVRLANPLADGKDFLRHNLYEGMVDRIDYNKKNKDLFDVDFVNIFEIGRVFSVSGEEMRMAVACERVKDLDGALTNFFGKLGIADYKTALVESGNGYAEFRFSDLVSKLPDKNSYDDLPPYLRSEVGSYKKFSIYPHVVRDIAVFVPSDVSADDVLSLIKQEATDLLVKYKLFDVFTKKFNDGVQKTSYAFRLIFQSEERTLAGEEISVIMDKITNVLNSKNGWKVR